ncbi:MAG TPA: UvrD-helicase domain-containing protein [Pirellulaceae bacterium]|nr:UvrD-helicase domain-containing protein [Planctomycetales bacterium]MCB9940140.1 UvrD-helicase domain-containing protein [Planctomycetaceae bacterium]HRX77589.1 UvrD-helicase domain-containing protein [Pirellulaceae bacterium]
MAHGLNPPQQKAVNTLSGPLLVLAGAGTGKTRVVTYRIAKLIKTGIQADRILAVTFTNKAAAEMQERIGGLLGKKNDRQPVACTFHSHCVRVLRRQIHHLGYPTKFSIYDRGDQESLARSVLREIRVPNETLRPGDLLYIIGGWKTKCIRPKDAAAVASTDKEHLAAMAYRRYQNGLKQRGAVDFDDLLLLTEELFANFEDVRREEASLFDHLLIDEYQDTNGSQYRIVKALAQDHRNLCVVGDDDQSIYGWRGAEVEHILRFSNDWPDATVVWLENNYRSTAEILTIANRLIAFNKKRHPKELKAARSGGKQPRIDQYPNETKEAEGVVADIGKLLRQPEWEPSDFAILFRTNEQPRAFETELRRVGLPYVLLGGMSFFDRKEVRDVLAYLKVIESPEDEVSLLRIINTPPRGLGGKSVETLTAAAVQQGKPLWSVLHQSAVVGSLPDAGQRACAELRSLVEMFQPRFENESMVDAMRAMLQRVDYESEINRLYDKPEDQQARMAALEELANALGAYEAKAKKPTLGGFLDDVSLGGPDFNDEKDKQLKRNAIVLMTLHSAKGLEFPHVYMVGMEEGLLPHHRSVAVEGEAIDEERRLCYVGVTRAQDYLTLSMALTRRKWGKPRDTIPSRFLFELIGQAENPHTANPAAQKRPPGAMRKKKVEAPAKRPSSEPARSTDKSSRRPRS